MQEEVTQRTVALCVEATKLSAGMLQQAMKKVLDEMQNGVTGHKTKLHHGKQTLRQLKLFQPEKETVGLCPRCGKPVYEGKKNFACSDRACQFVMWKNDRFWTSRRKEMTRKMAADLLKKGRTSVKGMWSEKKGSTYDAVVILDDTGGKYVNFKLEFPKRKDGVHGKK